MSKKIDVDKIEQLRQLAAIPYNSGEQFINVMLNIQGESGIINFGFGWKKDMGEYNFTSLDEAIEIVKELRKEANFK